MLPIFQVLRYCHKTPPRTLLMLFKYLLKSLEIHINEVVPCIAKTILGKPNFFDSECSSVKCKERTLGRRVRKHPSDEKRDVKDLFFSYRVLLDSKHDNYLKQVLRNRTSHSFLKDFNKPYATTSTNYPQEET